MVKSTEAESGDQEGKPTLRILLWVFGALLAMASLTYLVLSFLAFPALVEKGRPLWVVWEHPELRQLLTAAIPAAGLLAAGAAGAVGIRRQISIEASSVLDEKRYQLDQAVQQLDRDRHQLDRDRHTMEETRDDVAAVARLRDRYTTASGQLGNEAVAVRLAGAYATAALADDWIARGQRSEAQVCIDLLCAYVRVPHSESEYQEEVDAEREVRQTITRIITAHLQDPADEASWCGMDLDFTGATFDGVHSFARANFTGRTIFSTAKFRGYVGLEEAQFDGDVDFVAAQFSGTVLFSRAQFSRGTANFNVANFSRGGVLFDGAHFSRGTASFNGARFTDSHVNFGAHFFPGRSLSFDHALFSGGTVDFREAKFQGGHVSFHEASIQVDVPGPWGPQPPPFYPDPHPWAKESTSPE